MKHFSSELRQMFRDDLFKTVGQALRNDMPKALQHAMIEMVDERVFDSVDQMLDRFFHQDDMDCWLSFTRDGPTILIGMGPGDCAAQFSPELSIETYFDDKISFAEEKAVLDQIAGLKPFVAKLTESLRLLEARAKVFTGRVHELANSKGAAGQ
jgi:hypothetical protein